MRSSRINKKTRSSSEAEEFHADARASRRPSLFLFLRFVRCGGKWPTLELGKLGGALEVVFSPSVPWEGAWSYGVTTSSSPVGNGGAGERGEKGRKCKRVREEMPRAAPREGIRATHWAPDGHSHRHGQRR